MIVSKKLIRELRHRYGGDAEVLFWSWEDGSSYNLLNVDTDSGDLDVDDYTSLSSFLGQTVEEQEGWVLLDIYDAETGERPQALVHDNRVYWDSIQGGEKPGNVMAAYFGLLT